MATVMGDKWDKCDSLVGICRVEISEQQYDQIDTIPSSLNQNLQTRFKTNKQSALVWSEGGGGGMGKALTRGKEINKNVHFKWQANE